MASSNDYLTVMNNANTNFGQQSLADAISNFNPPPPPSVVDTKAAEVASTLAAKSADAGIPAPVDLSTESWRLDTQGASGGLGSLFNSSVLRAGGNLADAGRGISNKLFDTEFDDSEATGWSDVTNSDKTAGVSQEYRDKLSDDQGKVFDDIAGDNYWDAVKSAASVAFRTAADSGGTLPELAAGGLLSMLPGGQLGTGALAAKKIKKAADTVDKIKDRYDTAKELDLARKAGIAVNKIATESVKASFITADIVQQQRNAYKDANSGEEPSAERLAGNVMLTLATTIWQPTIAKKFFLPKTGLAGKTANEAKDQFIKDVQELVKRSDSSMFINLSKRIGGGIGHIAAAGGAEAVQEYAQTWAQILGVKMSPEEAGGFLKSAMEQFGDEANRDEALVGAYLGGAAGGAIKSISTVPSTVALATADTAIGTGKKVGNFVADKAAESSRKVLTSAEKAFKDDEYATKKAELDIMEKKNAEIYGNLAKNENYSQVTDKETQTLLLDAAKNEDLLDPKVFKKAKAEVTSKLKAETAGAKISLGADATARASVRAAKSAGKSTLEATKSAAKYLGVTEEKFDAAVEKTKVLSKTAYEDVKNLNSSTTRGLAVAAIEMGKESPKKVMEVANEYSPEALTKVAKVLEKDMPLLSKRMEKLAAKKKISLKHQKIKTESYHSFESIDRSIKSVANSGRIGDVREEVSFGSTLRETAKGEFQDLDAVKAMQKAVAVYKNTGTFKNNRKGAIPSAEIEALEKRLLKDSKKLKPAVKKVAEKTVDTANKVVDKAKTTYENLGRAAKEDKKAEKESKPEKSFDENLDAAINSVEKNVRKLKAGKLKAVRKLKKEFDDVRSGKTKLENVDISEITPEGSQMVQMILALKKKNTSSSDKVANKLAVNELVDGMLTKENINETALRMGTQEPEVVASVLAFTLPEIIELMPIEDLTDIVYDHLGVDKTNKADKDKIFTGVDENGKIQQHKKMEVPESVIRRIYSKLLGQDIICKV